MIHICLRSILILSSLLRLGLLKGLFPVEIPIKILKAVLASSILSIWPAHLNFLYLITLTILDERYKPLNFSWRRLLHSPFASLLDLNIRLRILFSNTIHVRYIASCAIWLWSMVSYIKGGMQAKCIRKQDPEANIWAQEGWEWGVEKAPQWGTS